MVLLSTAFLWFNRVVIYSRERSSTPACLIDLLFKMGAKVSYHAQRCYVHVASAFPLAHHYRAVLAWGF